MSDAEKPDTTTSTSNSTEVGKDPLAEALALAEKNKNEFLYLRAEFENYKRNVIKERSDYLKYGSERLIVELLSVLDNFERALEVKPTPEALAQYVKGVEMTAQDFKNTLSKFGVAELPALGHNFDPNVHEALSSEDSSEFQAGQVCRVFKKPYKLHDKVVRPAQVVVARSPRAQE